jgi:hypothetical protein
MLALFSFTLFLGAFLLFLVQPMVAKMVLPVLGGAPAVWNTCMVFFQLVLLGSYAYAHALPQRLGVRRHAALHLALIALAFVALARLALPARLAGAAAPAVENPVWWLLGLLSTTMGAPALALATGAPLLQRWFASSAHAERQDPYFLYVASNAGSLAALIGYPLLIEPRLTLAAQSKLWTDGVGLWVVATLACAISLWRARGAGEAAAATPAAADEAPLTRPQALRWVLLALVPSSLMLGVTTFMTIDIAPIPLLWVAPLAIYLLTFIIAFARPGLTVRRGALVLLPLAILALAAMPIFGSRLGIGGRIGVHLAAFFIAALVCHCELASTRPASRHLTAFYLWLSAGGVLGGLLNALVAPALFPRILEYPLLIAAIALLRPKTPTEAPSTGTFRKRARSAKTSRAGASGKARDFGAAWLTLGAFAALVFTIQAFGGTGATVFTHRDFFGLIRVKLDREHGLIGLQHGTTVHGVQSVDPARHREPLGYYTRGGPLGQLLASRAATHPGENLGVVGLGAGTIACYADSGQSLTFFEIDPAVERVARDTTYFTYLSDAVRRGVRLHVALGDARLELARTNERFGVLVLDAFSSDAVPVHLLTREALAAEIARIAPGGVLAFHLSSRYVRLEPAIAALARDANLAARFQHDAYATAADRAVGRSSSRWMVMARSEADLGAIANDPRWSAPGEALARVWSDDFSSLVGLVVWQSGQGR